MPAIHCRIFLSHCITCRDKGIHSISGKHILFFFHFGLGSWRRDCSSLAPLVVTVLVLTKKHPCDLYIFEMVAFHAKKI